MNLLETIVTGFAIWVGIGAIAVAIGIGHLKRWGEDNDLLWLTALAGPITAVVVLGIVVTSND